MIVNDFYISCLTEIILNDTFRCDLDGLKSADQIVSRPIQRKKRVKESEDGEESDDRMSDNARRREPDIIIPNSGY